MKKWSYRIVTGILVLVWMYVIFSFSRQPADESSEVSGRVCGNIVVTVNETFEMNMTPEEISGTAKIIEHPVRKAAHMTEYAILAILSYAFFHGMVRKEQRKYLYAILTVILYASSDEMHQYFVSGRSAQVTDVMIDTAGAVIGLVLFYFIVRFSRKCCEKRKYPLQ